MQMLKSPLSAPDMQVMQNSSSTILRKDLQFGRAQRPVRLSDLIRRGIDTLTFTSICQVSCLVFLKSLIMLFTLEPTMPGSFAALLLKVIRAFGIQLGGGLAYGNA